MLQETLRIVFKSFAAARRLSHIEIASNLEEEGFEIIFILSVMIEIIDQKRYVGAYFMSGPVNT